MKECKKCFEVKPDRKMFSTYKSYLAGYGTTTYYHLCKQCADNIGFKAIFEEAKEIENKLKRL